MAANEKTVSEIYDEIIASGHRYVPSKEAILIQEIFDKDGWNGLNRYFGQDVRPIGVIIREQNTKQIKF